MVPVLVLLPVRVPGILVCPNLVLAADVVEPMASSTVLAELAFCFLILLFSAGIELISFRCRTWRELPCSLIWSFCAVTWISTA